MDIIMLKHLIGLFRAPSEEERKLAQTINNSYKSLRVVGRGTIRIDPEEVFDSPEFKQDLDRAKRLING
ncbi:MULTISPECIES: hypothetical protein [Pseudomonas]|jgi:hypothetical protein|uniref:Uncharacterized protein n=2 Tax=Pseudomonas luteola TaxID=47886 RepID=A0A2X2EJI1_PSELU|nr:MULTISPECIES: hypothetical protein [Pseudomonas]ENA36593.1 hypothetical protein HMPREF1487_04760 [Pseudomonas sp. HPB0071]MBF8639937.1 hypothetical protein [Pseudomonas zeshuii]SHI31698.1 hypothetical protein SAMN05216295_101166 [Pseudomonas zeshuii]SPZ08449.1 Uncharacterised protein [Pseudomonas luteola]